MALTSLSAFTLQGCAKSKGTGTLSPPVFHPIQANFKSRAFLSYTSVCVVDPVEEEVDLGPSQPQDRRLKRPCLSRDHLYRLRTVGFQVFLDTSKSCQEITGVDIWTSLQRGALEHLQQETCITKGKDRGMVTVRISTSLAKRIL